MGVIESFLFDGIVHVFNKRILVPVIALLALILLVRMARYFDVQNHFKQIQFIFRIPTMVIYGVHPFVGLVVGRILAVISVPEIVKYFVSFVLVVAISNIAAIIVARIKVLNFVFNGNRR